MAMKRFIFCRVGSLVVLLLLLVGVQGCVVTPPVLKIGLVAPFEGADRAIGYDAIYAARLAVREVNEAGGVAGYKIALVALDDGGQPDLATQVAHSLVLDPQIVAVVGHGQAKTTAVVAPIYIEGNLLLLPLGSGAYEPVEPELLTADFLAAYEAVTPFDEVAGVYAGPTYQAFQDLFEHIAFLGEGSQEIGRDKLAISLHIDK